MLLKAERRAQETQFKFFYLQGMKINACLGCNGCAKAAKGSTNPCVQKDDMAQIYEAVLNAEVIVFASPIYFWTISGQLKTALDRFYALFQNLGMGGFKRSSVLLMTAGSTDFSKALNWYDYFEQVLGWKCLGKVLGAGKEEEAAELGASIH